MTTSSKDLAMDANHAPGLLTAARERRGRLYSNNNCANISINQIVYEDGNYKITKTFEHFLAGKVQFIGAWTRYLNSDLSVCYLCNVFEYIYVYACVMNNLVSKCYCV